MLVGKEATGESRIPGAVGSNGQLQARQLSFPGRAHVGVPELCAPATNGNPHTTVGDVQLETVSLIIRGDRILPLIDTSGVRSMACSSACASRFCSMCKCWS